MAKAKSVSLRKYQPKTNGSQSFYLEYYEGYTKKENGNVEPIRKREMITGLFLYAKPKNAKIYIDISKGYFFTTDKI